MSPQIAWVAARRRRPSRCRLGDFDLKYADGYTRLGWSIVSLDPAGGVPSFLLGRRVAGAGNRRRLHGLDRNPRAVGILLTMGVLLFGEALSPLKIAGIVMVMIGIVAPKLAPA